mmetsp:Transcript_18778/g.45119  ORF Transcript_18778/g.45119 Transcript_18778/m.45119 type:complete len:417 (+) Transcript_18778:755-2005(+)
MFTRDEATRTVGEAVRYNNFLNLIIKNLLHEFAESFSLGLGFLKGLLLILIFIHLKSFLGGAEELLALELLQLLDAVLINRVHHVNDLIPLLLELLQEGRCLNTALRLASNVVDARLLVVHATHVILKAGHGVARLSRVVPKELGNLGTVGRVLMDAKLQVLAEGLVELVVCVFILCQVVEHLKALLHQVLLDDTEDLVLLESLTGNVEGKVLRVNHSLDEAEPLGHEVLAVVLDENTAHIEFDVVVLLLISALEHVEWSALGAEEDSAELKLALNRKVLDGRMLLPVIGYGLVEGGILVLGNIVRLAHPDGFHVVEVLPLVTDLLNFLGLLLLLGLLFIINFLNLGLVIISGFIIIIVVVARGGHRRRGNGMIRTIILRFLTVHQIAQRVPRILHRVRAHVHTAPVEDRAIERST